MSHYLIAPANENEIRNIKKKGMIPMEQKKSKKKILIIVIFAVLIGVIGALGAVIYQLTNKQNQVQSQKRAVSEGLVVEENRDRKASEARFTTDMNMIWTFPSGSDTSNNAEIGNSASNLYECYFEVYLDNEEQTLLYSSPVLPVGSRIDKLKLNQVLPDGSYEAICTYHILDDEDPEQELGTVSFAVSLIFMK